jgi:hypothetical protein
VIKGDPRHGAHRRGSDKDPALASLAKRLGALLRKVDPPPPNLDPDAKRLFGRRNPGGGR